MHEFLEHGSHLIPQLARDPLPTLLRELFRSRVRHWGYPFVEVEGGAFGLFDDLFGVLSPESAFDLTPTAAELVLEASTEERSAQAAWLLAGLVGRADTTEMHDGLERLWPQLLARLEAAARFTRDAERARLALIGRLRRSG